MSGTCGDVQGALPKAFVALQESRSLPSFRGKDPILLVIVFALAEGTKCRQTLLQILVCS